MFGTLLSIEFKKCTPLWREAHFEVKSVKNWRSRIILPGLGCRKGARRCGPKRMSKSKCKNNTCSGHFWIFPWQAQRILHLAQGEKKLESFVAVAKSDGKRGALEVDLQRLISSGRHRQETCESGMFGGQGADFLRRVAFWSIRSSGSLR